jgi:DNA adenine methylase
MANNSRTEINTEIEMYLKKIKSKTSQQTYKRITLSPLRYAGGKSKAIGLILHHFPKTLKEKKVVSLFMGGGSLEIVLSKELGFDVVAYDIFEILVNYWQQQIQQPEELYEVLKTLIPDKENFTKNRHILLNYWEKVKPTDLHYETKNRLPLTDEEKNLLDNDKLVQAAYYYYNMQLSYGPMFLGWPSNVYLNGKRYKSILANVKTFQPKSLDVRCATFEEAVKNHPNDFLFCDPPYYLGEKSKMFKGMYPNCNFAIHHNKFDHELLCEMLKKHKGGFFLTYNDCPKIREMYKDYKQEFPKWQYTYGQGEKRIGKNRQEGETSNVKESHEIFIICEPYTSED